MGISLPVFPSRTNLKQNNISVTPKMVKKVITSLDLSKVSSPPIPGFELVKQNWFAKISECSAKKDLPQAKNDLDL